MGNPLCPKKDLLGRVCHGLLKRQHSGRRAFWVCTKNKKHRVRVGSVFDSVLDEIEEEAWQT